MVSSGSKPKPVSGRELLLNDTHTNIKSEAMKNLLGNYVVTPDHIAQELIISNVAQHDIFARDATKQGFMLSDDSGILKNQKSSHHGVKGFYAIYKNGVCLYLGKSDVSIGTRLGRFVKEVYGRSRLDEDHPAARRYRAIWGRDLSGVTVRLFPCISQNDITHLEIETNLRRMLKPLLNSKR
jgi:hypothetical protein